MTEQTQALTSAAAERGPLAMEAVSVSKDFRIGRGQTLHACGQVDRPPVCGELLILAECTVEVQTCESFAGR